MSGERRNSFLRLLSRDIYNKSKRPPHQAVPAPTTTATNPTGGASIESGGTSDNLEVNNAANPNAIKKSGYLVKMASKSTRNWKKRYFVLNGQSLMYYVDHVNTEYVKGEVSLSGGVVVEEKEKRETGRAFCLGIRTVGGNQMIIAAKDEEEMKEWKEAIESVITSCNLLLKGYAIKADTSGDVATSMKYFILNGNTLTYHQDHAHSNAIQGMLKVNEASTLNITEEPTKSIEIMNEKGNER